MVDRSLHAFRVCLIAASVSTPMGAIAQQPLSPVPSAAYVMVTYVLLAEK